ncbi:MAG: hypothetical protein JSS27_07175 [Planctomycetes bacterium]|nr:hypothetical protein [Planctomycetota bacterium]
MATIRCPFCHLDFDESAFPAHQAQHLKLRSDGQHTDYVSLPHEEQVAGDLSGVPTVYVHRSCGVQTVMPEKIVRSYLANPFLYMSDNTYCCGCQTHVPLGQCNWTETGEDLQLYMNRLRADKRPAPPRDWFRVFLWLMVGLLALIVFAGVVKSILVS